MSKVIFPGTFDPIHLGHVDIARRASVLFDEVVVAVYDKPAKQLTFSPEERVEQVRIAFRDIPNITVIGYSGLTVKLATELGARAIIRGLRVFSDFETEFRIALANQRLEPAIGTIAFITNEENSFVSSTIVKEIASLGGDVTSMVPRHVAKALVRKYTGHKDTAA
ncbi:MAG: pantetheine-phosphate adenylyltransferase [Anaerolineaceae bacterium]|jgi:pantetheine-phosphate adenylyltransferase